LELLLIAQVATAAELANVWHAVSSSSEKLEWLTLQSHANAVPLDLGIPKSALNISPTLCAKIMGLQFDVVNVNDLGEGIHPFSVGSRGTAASHSARTNSANHDLLHQGSLGDTTADTKTLSNADKVSMPMNLFHVASAFSVV
jgi:hypothetical protein